MNTYPTGSNIKFFVIFEDPVTGAFVDPTIITFKILSPGTGIITIYMLPPGPEVVKDSTGHYHTTFTLDFPGVWYYRWEGSGAYIGAKEAYVCAQDTVF